MPKRSERARFDSQAFELNPFEGKQAVDIYSEINWGNKPKRIHSIKCSESLVKLGTLACIYHDGRCNPLDDGEYSVAIGIRSNYVYFIPLRCRVIPSFKNENWFQGPKVTRTDYLSEKGGEETNYYYHKHERPYPYLFVSDNNCGVLIPSNNNGRRSYAVVKEGIVG